MIYVTPAARLNLAKNTHDTRYELALKKNFLVGLVGSSSLFS